MFQSYYQYEKIQDTQRKKIDKIPEKAFREAIANALVHRMWDVNASIKVILPVITDGSNLTKPEKELVNLLRENEKMSRLEIEKNADWGKDKTIRIINLLLKKNIIYKEGRGRGTKYGINK